MHLGVFSRQLHLSVPAVVAMVELKIENSPDIYEQLEKHGSYLKHPVALRVQRAEERPALVSQGGLAVVRVAAATGR